jgi:alanine racemase
MITLSEVLASTGGTLSGPASPECFDSYCFDSRLAKPGQLFLAIRSERRDGHDFIGDALAAGCAGVLCERAPERESGVAWVVVPCVTQAIQDVARHVISSRNVEVIGVTGSVGKTTAKEAIAAVLSGCLPVFKSPANYNGSFGLPVAVGLLGVTERVAVLEMAADHFGEIRRLCQIAPPSIAVVTTVEPAHLQTFGTLDGVAQEKSALVQALPSGALAVLNADDQRVSAMRHATQARVVTYGLRRETQPDVFADGVLMTRGGVRFVAHTAAGSQPIHLALLGRHQVYAALAAIAVGLEKGMNLDAIGGRLEAVSPLPGRLSPLSGIRGTLLLDDSYSASPAAVEAALETLGAVEARRRIAVLGDMLELGTYEASGHEAVGRRVVEVADLLVTKGERARRIADSARASGMPADRILVTYTAEDALRMVSDRLGPGDVVLIKGSSATRMEQVVRDLLARPDEAEERLVRQDEAWRQIVTVQPERPTWLEIDLGAIAGNVRLLKERAGRAGILISLKADAYGHGAVQVAHTALHNGASWLGVACLSEGVALREAGIDAPILILGYTPAWQARDAVRHRLTATVFDLGTAQALSRAALALEMEARVHVKIDTGMHRLGVEPEAALAIIREMMPLPSLVVEGIFTHLATADGDDPFALGYSQDQMTTFVRLLDELSNAGVRPPLVHALNSAALLGPALRDASLPIQSSLLGQGALIRAGIAVYGLDPSSEVTCPVGFRSALAWKTQIAQVKPMPVGSFVGYGATYRAQESGFLAVIPVGYADGFRRSPAHWGEVLVRGMRAPIIGRVCMDQTMIDVTGVPGVRQGDEVVLIGRQGSDSISAEEVGRRLGTINYEVVSAILARVPRTSVA